MTYIPFNSEKYYNYDLREPITKIFHPDKFKENTKSVAVTTEWTNIPYYPTNLEKKENLAKHLHSIGKPIPLILFQQIEEERKKEFASDSAKPATKSVPQAPHKYSPQYANFIGAKPRAQASARISMGGIY
jgi:chromatin remodeling complex protein RSC6